MYVIKRNESEETKMFKDVRDLAIQTFGFEDFYTVEEWAEDELIDEREDFEY